MEVHILRYAIAKTRAMPGGGPGPVWGLCTRCHPGPMQTRSFVRYLVVLAQVQYLG